MGKWADRLAALEAEISRTPRYGATDKTDKTRVLSVLAVPGEGDAEDFSAPATDPPRTCTTCAHCLPRGTCAQPEAAGLIPAGAGFGIVWPEPGHAARCTAFKATPGQAADRPYKLSRAEGDEAHAEPWDDAAIARFQARARRIRRRGFEEQDADDLAERLYLRDVHADHRALCLECRHLAGAVATGWRCGNHRSAGLQAAATQHQLPGQLQQCPGFESGE